MNKLMELKDYSIKILKDNLNRLIEYLNRIITNKTENIIENKYNKIIDISPSINDYIKSNDITNLNYTFF